MAPYVVKNESHLYPLPITRLLFPRFVAPEFPVGLNYPRCGGSDPSIKVTLEVKNIVSYAGEIAWKISHRQSKTRLDRRPYHVCD